MASAPFCASACCRPRAHSDIDLVAKHEGYFSRPSLRSVSRYCDLLTVQSNIPCRTSGETNNCWAMRPNRLGPISLTRLEWENCVVATFRPSTSNTQARCFERARGANLNFVRRQLRSFSAGSGIYSGGRSNHATQIAKLFRHRAGQGF